MLNEDKIKLMTSISLFEQKEGKHIFPVNRYFKSDYVSKYMIRSFFGYTFSYLLVMVIWILYSMDFLINQSSLESLTALGWRAASVYVVGLAVYLVVTWIVYAKRYDYARRGLKVYMAKLRRLEKRYEFQDKTKELEKGGRTS